MNKPTPKKNLLAELTNRKTEEQKSGTAKESFGKFKTGTARNAKKSPVGPARGGRKGN